MRRAILILTLLFLLPLVQAFCPVPPSLDVTPSQGAIVVDRTMRGTLSSDDPLAILGATNLDEESTLTYGDGRFTLKTNSTANQTKILFYAVAPDGCTGTVVVTYAIRRPPLITTTPPVGNLTVTEGRALRFTATAEAVVTRWLLDGDVVARKNTSFAYRADYNSAGRHTLTFVVQDEHGLVNNATWYLEVRNKNRAPVQVTKFLDAALPLGSEFTINLSHYFLDADKTKMDYVIETAGTTGYFETANLTITQKADMVTFHGDKEGKIFITVTATDPIGATATANTFAILVAGDVTRVAQTSYCGDNICFIDENCASCPEDCGMCNAEKCTPQWDCTPWGQCRFPGIQQRTCVVVNNCTEEGDVPADFQECDYEPRCDDGVMNGNETGVDCGGSCSPCPTCDDGLQNQGEEDVDCGGPCDPCPSCDDGLQNQKESDIDCGGPCDPCLPGSHCFVPAECNSYHCLAGVCQEASCDDNVLNQDEEETDCGGVCDPCPTCDDEQKNQDEYLVDCGGPCRECVWQDWIPVVLRWLFWPALALLTFSIIYLIRSIITSRILFLFKHGKVIHFFYEDGPTYKMVCGWNAFAKHLRIHRHKEMKEHIEQAIADLEEMRQHPPEHWKTALTERLHSLYGSMFSLGASSQLEILVYTVKKSKLPFCIKVIVLRNTKMLAMIELSKLYHSAEPAIDDVLRAIEELRKAF